MWLRMMVAAFLAVLCIGVQAAERTFVIVGKSRKDSNFIEVYSGCQEEARKHGDRCIQGGPRESAHFRKQNDALRAAIDQEPDGIALSVTRGPFLKNNALSRRLSNHTPLITFDSDFTLANQDLREAYVGPDNELIGARLARLLAEGQVPPGRICFLSSDPGDINLRQRIAGARHYLKENTAWQEASRCPLYNKDSINVALKQVQYVLQNRIASAIISVGAWPVLAAERYSTAVSVLGPERSEPVPVLVAAGKLRPVDFRLLARGQVTGFVSVDFRAMGRELYSTLRRLAEGEDVPAFIKTPVSSVSAAAAGPVEKEPDQPFQPVKPNP